MQVSDILEAKTSEIDRINELNFIITNKIQEMDFLIEQTKKAIENLKEIDFFQEEERDVFFINSINSKLNNELINSVVTLRNRFGKEVKRQNYNKKTIEKITKEIKQLKSAVYSQTFERKYLNTLNIIDEEDTMEIKDTSLNASIHMNNIKRKSISGMRKSFSIPKLNFTKLKANEDNSIKEEMITSLRSIDNNKKSRNSDTNLYYVNTTSMDNNYSMVHYSHVSISKDDSNIKEK